MLAWMVVDLQKDFEETWAYRGDEVNVAPVEEVGVGDALAWA